MAGSLAATEGHCVDRRVLAERRLRLSGEFEDAAILKIIGEVDIGLMSV